MNNCIKRNIPENISTTDEILCQLDMLISKNLTAEVMKDMDRCLSLLTAEKTNKR